MKNLGFLGCSKYSVDVFGNVYSRYSKRFLKPCLDKDGYLFINLCKDDSTHWRVPIHRLVGLCYCENPNNKPQINHKDGNKQNNFYKNLEWCTSQENTIHAYKNNLYKSKKGLSVDTIHEVCRMLEQGFKNKEITAILGIEKIRYVQMIRNKERWTCISDEYKFEHIPNRTRIDTPTVIKICAALEKGLSLPKIAKKYGVGTSTVHRIKHKKTYSDISAPYNF